MKLLLLLLMFANILFANKLIFTQEENDYIKQKQSVNIVMLNDFKPFSYMHKNKHQGLSVDIIDKISILCSLKFNIQTSSWSKALGDFKNKKVDMISGISYTKKREDFTLFTKPFYEIPTYIFGLKDDIQYKSVKDLKGKRVGVNQDMFYIDSLKKLGIKVKQYDGSNQKVKALAFGDIDYFLANYTTGLKAIKFQSATNIKAIDEFTGIKREDLRYGVNKENIILHSIIEKSLNQIKSNKLEYLINKWVLGLNKLSPVTIELTQEEKKYLKNNPTIKVHNEMNWAPLNYNKNGKPLGYSIEYIALLASKVNLNIEFINGYSWNQFMKMLKNNKIDVMLNIAKTQEREKYLAYTTSYYRGIDVVFTKDNTSYNCLKDFKGKTIAVVKGFYEEELLKRFYPNIKLLTASNSLDTLNFVSFGKADGYVDNLSTGNFLTREYGLTNIRPSFEIKDKRFNLNLHIATNKNNKILRDILEKAKQQITEQELQNIKNIWFSSNSKVKNNNTNKVSLTKEEKEFIKSHTFKVGVEQWKPAIYSNNGSDIDGVTGDFLKEIIKLTGLKVKIVNDKWSNIISGLENKTIDIIPATYYTKNREKFGLYGDPYFKMKDFIYIKQDNNTIHSLRNLNGKTLAITKGNGRIDDIKQHFPKINFAFTKDYNEAINLLLNNQVDAIYDSQLTMDSMLREQMIIGIKGIPQKRFKTPSLHFFSRIDKPILQSILHKGLKAISKQKRDEIKNKWLGKSIVKEKKIRLDLTSKQKKYLKDKKVIKMCVDPDWMPFEKIENKKHIGIASDYLKLFSQRIDIPIQLVQTSSWTQSLDKAKNRECDIFSLATSTKSRREYMDFTAAYLTAPIVIATKIGIPFTDNLKTIVHKKLGVVKGYSLHETLKKEYSNINLVEVESIQDGLNKVQSGKIFGYLDNSIVINYEIQRNYIGTLSVSGKFINKFKLAVATRNDNPILNKIFQKAVDSISASDTQKILNKWVNVSYASKTNYTLVWQILIVVFIIGIFALYRHILLRKQKQKLEDSINVFEALLDSSLEGILIFDENNICIEVNNKALEIYNADNKADAIGRNALDFVSQESLPIVHNHLLEKNTESYEANFLRKNGEKFPALVRGKTTILNGKAVRVSAVLDMTDIKNKETLLIEAKQKAEQASKTKSQFLANMSHEIRTPMSGIIGMSHLALKTDLTYKQKNYIQKIDNSANSLLSIINDILDFSKIEAGKLDINKIDFEFKYFITNISNIVKFKADEKGLDFDINYDENISYCYGDSLRISQILINLINNAIKFTNVGYVKLNISNPSKNDIYKFEIIDSGIGISSQNQKKLFQSFSQADGSTTREYGGTGLGLSISKQLVELMDGEIWCESELKKGSKFIFEIKLGKGNKDNIKDKKQIDIDEITALKGSYILLVEDNLINQEIIIGLLENSGIIIDIANNGKEAIEKFKNNQYELILMDLQMPIMGGLEATKIIRETSEDIPIIALTANVLKEDIEKTKNAKMNEHLNKPIAVKELYETLLKYISKKNIKYKISNTKNENINIPLFANIDTNIGLSHMANNKELYLKVLRDFYTNNKNLKLEEFSDDEFKIKIHNIKGLSASIGAMTLHKIIKEINISQDRNLLYKLYEELNKVINELKILSSNTQSTTLLNINQKDIKKLFIKLKKALSSKRPKQYKPIVKEIEKYKLDTQEEYFNQIKSLVNKYKISDAIIYINKILK